MIRFLTAVMFVALAVGQAQAASAVEIVPGAWVRDEIDCLALNVYFEARGESEIGQRAVAHVVMNRVGDFRFPETACETIRQGHDKGLHKCQFSWLCDGLTDQPVDRRAWRQAKIIAEDVYYRASSDPTGGALWYHADYVAPWWRTALAEGPIIGQHVFYLDPAAGPKALPASGVRLASLEPEPDPVTRGRMDFVRPGMVPSHIHLIRVGSIR